MALHLWGHAQRVSERLSLETNLTAAPDRLNADANVHWDSADNLFGRRRVCAKRV